jgi:hypothetical protein
MAQRHVVVDGSNLATEGRSTPSLAQLDQAVREFLLENPDAIVTVVVDASFGHRIDPSELETFEEAEAAGEVVSPPAGAIGRGDAFLLRIADKTGATVLSNDSFQEFHGEHEWLFDKGRLIGGKPVPGVGWIFTPRTPVRGPKSREAVKEAKQKRKVEPVSAIPGLDLAAERAARAKGKGKKTVERAIAVATEEAVAPKEARRRRRRKATSPPAEPVNEPLTFITFIAAHPLGSEVDATIESFSSHGAFVNVDGARCYVPLSAMGNPAPKSAREVLGKGNTARFVIQALDPQRRGIELALPGYAKVAGAPTEETVEAEITSAAEEQAAEEQAAAEPEPVKAVANRSRSRGRAAKAVPAPETDNGLAPAHPALADGPSAAKKAAAKRAEAGAAAAGQKKAAAARTAEGRKKAAAEKAEAGAAAVGRKKAAAEKAEAGAAAAGRKKAAADKAEAGATAEGRKKAAAVRTAEGRKKAAAEPAAPAKKVAKRSPAKKAAAGPATDVGKEVAADEGGGARAAGTPARKAGQGRVPAKAPVGPKAAAPTIPAGVAPAEEAEAPPVKKRASRKAAVKKAPASESPADVTVVAAPAPGAEASASDQGPPAAKRTGRRAAAKKAAPADEPEAGAEPTAPATTARRAKKAPADRPAAMRKSTPTGG